MTFERFKQLWEQAGLNNPPKFDNPIMVDGCSPELEAALIKASEGDFSEFDKISRVLA